MVNFEKENTFLTRDFFISLKKGQNPEKSEMTDDKGHKLVRALFYKILL